MKYIAPIAVIGIVLLQLSGAVPTASVGGPLTIALAFIAGAAAVAIHEAWSKQRGVLGWIANIVLALGGGFVGAGAGSMALEALLTQMHFQGSLAASGHPLLYASLAGEMLLTVLGAWVALWLVNRLR
jgi:hypothetical protein